MKPSYFFPFGSSKIPMENQDAFHRVCQSIAARRQRNKDTAKAADIFVSRFERVKQSANL